jgi:hypothetical protein
MLFTQAHTMSEAKKEEALKFGMAMAKRTSYREAPGAPSQVVTESRGSTVLQKSPRTSKRDSNFEGLNNQGTGEEKVSVAESALSRGFRLVTDLFDDEKKASISTKRDALVCILCCLAFLWFHLFFRQSKYADQIEVQESNLKGLKDPKAAKLIAEHREILEGYNEILNEKK